MTLDPRPSTLHPGPSGRDRPLILASASPRRHELLALLALPFEVLPAEVDESAHDAIAPADRVRRLAADKACAVSQRRPEALVIGADTLVIVATDVLGKPGDAEEARQMLRLLSGLTHQVATGIALAAGGALLDADAVSTDVTFRALAEVEIEAYVATGEPMDKAGAYAIQGYGAFLIESIRGDYPNVVGLPLTRLARMLREYHVTVFGMP